MRFADTSFWVGLQLPRDRRHDEAVALWSAGRVPVRTSTLVVGETWTFLSRRAGHEAAVRFVDRVDESPRVSVVGVDEGVDARAWEWLRRHDERVYSYVDATSFEIMRRERIVEALAFDGDFAAAGFVEARASG
jgi:predicted nucleic acid-binding protein